MTNNPVVWRASTLHFLADPASVPVNQAIEFYDDGAVVVENGHILAAGAFDEIIKGLPANTHINHLPGRILLPGFIDIHAHYPQLEMIGACGNQLIDWLQNYTYPTEAKFDSYVYASEAAKFFLDQCLSHGTTTALVFGTTNMASVDAFFDACSEKNVRMIAGKVMMDRNAPDVLLDTAESSYLHSEELIQRWHGKGRLSYAVTPRFAPTSTPEQLTMAGSLLNQYDDVYLHTHLAENSEEVEWVQKLYPDCKSYLDVYDKYGLLSPRSVFAHAIHLNGDSWQQLATSDATLAFCPSSNLFLGSGLFSFDKAGMHDIKVGLGSDVGAGTSLCLLESMKNAYQVGQLQGSPLSPLSAFYLATLGGAKALGLSDKIGSFQVGNEADFLVINPEATPFLGFRMSKAKTLEEKLAVMMITGDDRLIETTVIMGEVYNQRLS